MLLGGKSARPEIRLPASPRTVEVNVSFATDVASSMFARPSFRLGRMTRASGPS
jgi:hypothetical protein